MLATAADWAEFATALLVFMATHAIPARPPVRRRLVALAGRGAYLVGYSLVSLLVLAWLIAAAARAPFIELWPREEWQTLVPVIAMPVVCLLLVFGLTTPNPLSLGQGGAARFDPDRPGVAGVVRHPVLWAALLWSLSHLLPNGDLAHVVLFGVFALLAAAGMLLLDRRGRRALGDAGWRQLAARTSNLPLLGFARGWRPRPGWRDLAKAALGGALYLVLVGGHQWIAGVPVPI